jgi:putative ABC transport system substrate-binding protein
MKRRVLLLAGAAILTAGRASAQSGSRVRRVAILTTAGARGETPFYVALEARFRELGYIEGKNLSLAWQATGGDLVELGHIAAQLARSKPEVTIAAGSELAVRSLRQAVGTTPIVMIAIDFDPVERNFVASLARPGGSITGLFLRQVETAAKRLELMKEALPTVTRVCVLYDALSKDQLLPVELAAKRLGVTALPHEMRGASYDFQGPLEKAARQQAQAVLALTSGRFFQLRDKMIGAAFRHGLPVVAIPNYAEAGALVTYGADFSAMFRRAADYVDRILKGARPAELPVEQPTKYDLIINLKTAKALGLSLPASLLARADRVIE